MALRLRFWKRPPPPPPAEPGGAPARPDKGSALPLVVRLFRETFRRYLVGYIIAIFFMVLTAAMLALTAWIMSDIVNKVFLDKSVPDLIFVSGAVLVISLLRGLGIYGSTVAMARIGNSIVARTQKRIFDHLLTLETNFFSKNASSDLITRISFNANSVRDLLSTVITGVGRDLLSLIGLVAVMVYQSPLMSVIALVIGPIAIIGVTSLVRRIREIVRSEVFSMGQIVASVQESARGIRIVKAFGLEERMRARMSGAVEAVRRRANKVAGIQARTAPIMETLGGFAVAGVIVWAGMATIYYDTQPGAFMSFITAILLAYEPAKRLANTRVTIEMGLVSLRMLYELLDTKPTMDPNNEGPRLKVRGGDVHFRAVTFRYDGRKPLFRDFNFQAEAGKMTALVGPSGSGKSSIINLIERFYDVRAGAVEIDGQDVSKVQLASLRSQIALVSQDVVLFDGTIRDNIRFGRLGATDGEVEEAARSAMAHDFIMALRKNYETEIEDGGTQLSGGQRQRIAIARAMLRRAPIVLLDEATSALDSESEHQVQVAFDRLTEGRTTIVIAHRLSTVLGADKICVLDGGKIVEEGRHAELLAADRDYAKLYKLQFEKAGRGNGTTAPGTATPDDAPKPKPGQKARPVGGRAAAGRRNRNEEERA